jgi:hypothetical protein
VILSTQVQTHCIAMAIAQPSMNKSYKVNPLQRNRELNFVQQTALDLPSPSTPKLTPLLMRRIRLMRIHLLTIRRLYCIHRFVLSRRLHWTAHMRYRRIRHLLVPVCGRWREGGTGRHRRRLMHAHHRWVARESGRLVHARWCGVVGNGLVLLGCALSAAFAA